LRQIVAGGFYMQVLAGTPEQIVDRMLHLSHAGIDDLNMTFVDNQNELHAIIHHVLPLQEQARLRRRFAAREVAQQAGL
jgi:alkanesulfonate monooxygenase SsuD/methylene tetrahydromethanopterin reductase-like flavin-dependent oxidoreductase (luciferase family)